MRQIFLRWKTTFQERRFGYAQIFQKNEKSEEDCDRQLQETTYSNTEMPAFRQLIILLSFCIFYNMLFSLNMLHHSTFSIVLFNYYSILLCAFQYILFINVIFCSINHILHLYFLCYYQYLSVWRCMSQVRCVSSELCWWHNWVAPRQNLVNFHMVENPHSWSVLLI